jgi:hypothetical protein
MAVAAAGGSGGRIVRGNTRSARWGSRAVRKDDSPVKFLWLSTAKFCMPSGDFQSGRVFFIQLELKSEYGISKGLRKIIGGFTAVL